jgi:hypothetical protein
MSKRGLVLGIIAATLSLAAPAAASAATRFASPAGTASATCPIATPCDIGTAINSAAAGDTVIIEPGQYGSPGAPISAQLTDNGNQLTVEGAGLGANLPVIYATARSIWTGAGTVIENFDIESSGNGGVYVPNGHGPVTITDVIAHSSGANGNGCVLSGPFSITDSVCLSTGTGGTGLDVGNFSAGTVRNVTAIGPKFGLFAASAPQTGTLTLVNSILSGGQYDMEAQTVLTDQLTVNASHDDFSSVSNSGATINQTGTVNAAPKFVDAANGNVRELESSPTVDAGVDDPANGTTDPDGNARTQGARTDIGAYEFMPAAPSAITGPASNVTTATASVGGTVDPGDQTTTYEFLYGQTTSYGATATGGSVPTGTSAVSVSGQLTNLKPNTTYHYELVATNGSDSALGGDRTFTTAPLTPPRASTPPSISGTGKAGRTLTCAPGTWSHNPTAFTYQWYRNGTPIQGATRSTYTVQRLDEGTTLTCTVTALNADGSGQATSKGFNVPVPHVPRCPAATGSYSGTHIGPVRLGMTSRQAHHAFTHSSNRGFKYKDFFCLTPYGVRVGYTSPKLLDHLSRSEQRKLRGRVVWISTDNARYAIHGIRAGATLDAARKALPHGYYFRVGKNWWYLAPAGKATAVLKLRHNIVQEVGIADMGLTRTHKADKVLMTSFD